MVKNTLVAQTRDITGKKVKHLRRDGILPASLYGQGITSRSLQVSYKDFTKLVDKAGDSGLIYLRLDNDEKPVLMVNPQYHPVSGDLLHIDFHQVDLSETITTSIPLEILGEPAAVSEGKGILIQTLSEIEVEALPTNLPEKFTVEVSSLTEVDQAVYVKDIPVPPSVKILSNPEDMIAKINALAKEEVTTPPATLEVAQVGGETPPPTPDSTPATNTEEQ